MEPIGGTQSYVDISAVAEASKKAIEAARVTQALLEMMLKEWHLIFHKNERAIAYRKLIIIEVERLNTTLETLEKLQYPSHFRTTGEM